MAGRSTAAHEQVVDLADRGITVRCRMVGSGPPLVLCAGTGYPLDSWPESFLRPLAARFKLVLFDYRGTGGSSSTSGTYSTRMFAADGAALLTALGIERASVLGHSMGGRVAQFMALDTPERVLRLVLIATGAGEALEAGTQEAGIPLDTAVRMIESGYRNYLVDNVTKLFFPPDVLAERGDLVDEVVGPFWDHRPSVRDYLKHVQARQAHFAADRLGDISCLTLVVIGERDDYPGRTGSHLAQSKFLAAHIPGAELCVIPDVSHGLFWQAPQAAADVVSSWLTS